MAKKITFANIQAGDELLLTFGNERYDWDTPCKFLGFTKIDEKYSDTPFFKTLKEVKKYYNVRRAGEIEQLGYANNMPYGHSVYAVFKDLDGSGLVWSAYLFEGKWSAGTSALPIHLNKLPETV